MRAKKQYSENYTRTCCCKKASKQESVIRIRRKRKGGQQIILFVSTLRCCEEDDGWKRTQTNKEQCEISKNRKQNNEKNCWN